MPLSQNSPTTKKKIVTLTLLTLIGIGLVLVGNYYADRGDSGESGEQTPIDKMYQTLIDQTSSIDGLTPHSTALRQQHLPIWQPDSDMFVAAQEISPNYLTFSAESTDTYDTFVNEVELLLDKYSLVPADVPDSSPLAQFRNSELTCYRSNAPDTTLAFGCVENQVIENYTEFAAPFYKVAQAIEPTLEQPIVRISEQDVQQPDSSFTRASATIYNVANTDILTALFYRPIDTEEWQVITSPQTILDCSEFENQAAQQAFSDLRCFDIAQPTELTTVGQFHSVTE